MEKINGFSMNTLENKTNTLKKLFPNVITEDGKINFDKLKDVLSNDLDESIEKYQFTWPGKKKTIKISQSPSTSTLRPQYERSKNWDSTENLYLEGDNLEVLKQLQKTYFSKIKMIYIDPPYNTGGDFIYKDNFRDKISNYKEDTNQGKRVNPEIGGRFHSDWLNMMYSRILLSKNLLKDNGVFIVSISDVEIANLKKICDEIFGEDNHLGTIMWNSTKSVTNTALMSVSHTYNLVYVKDIDYFIENRHELRLPEEGKGFSNPDNDPRGSWKADPFQVGGWRPNQQYEIVNPKTKKVYKPNKGSSWKNDYKKFKELLADNRIVFGKTGEGGPQRKRFLSEATDRGKVSKTWWDDVQTTTNGTQTLKKLFEGSALFDNPKPVELIKKFISLATYDKNDIVLDFFSGSSTTAHAVMEKNAEDGLNRKFIMVQLPEKTSEESDAYKKGFKTICDIGRERIKRAADQIVINNKKIAIKANNLDVGFKTFKVDTSNLKEWDSTEKLTVKTLLDQIEIIKENRSEDDVLYEIILKYGLFDKKIEKSITNGKPLFKVDNGKMIVSLIDEINKEDINEIAKLKPETVVFNENGFQKDSSKINALHTLKKMGVEDIKSI